MIDYDNTFGRAHQLAQEHMKLVEGLRQIVGALHAYVQHNFNKHVVITSVFRDDPTSVHAYWRGVDIRSWIYTQAETRKIVAFVNGNFPYGDGVHQTAIYHDVGQGIHFHLQVRARPGPVLPPEDEDDPATPDEAPKRRFRWRCLRAIIHRA